MIFLWVSLLPVIYWWFLCITALIALRNSPVPITCPSWLSAAMVTATSGTNQVSTFSLSTLLPKCGPWKGKYMCKNTCTSSHLPSKVQQPPKEELQIQNLDVWFKKKKEIRCLLKTKKKVDGWLLARGSSIKFLTLSSCPLSVSSRAGSLRPGGRSFEGAVQSQRALRGA